MCVTSSAAKAKRLRELGAGEVIDRNQAPAWEHAVLEMTGGDGVEHVVDVVGLPTMAKSVACGAFNARITVIGAFPATEPVTDPFGGRYLAIRRIAVGSRADFEAMNRAVRAHRMRPVIDRVLPFDEAVQAYRYFRDGNPFGKVVVELQPLSLHDKSVFSVNVMLLGKMSKETLEIESARVGNCKCGHWPEWRPAHS